MTRLALLMLALLSLAAPARARFTYKRDPRFGPGWNGAFVYRATGTPVDLTLSSAPRDTAPR